MCKRNDCGFQETSALLFRFPRAVFRLQLCSGRSNQPFTGAIVVPIADELLRE
jgi:hypothetical protein